MYGHMNISMHNKKGTVRFVELTLMAGEAIAHEHIVLHVMFICVLSHTRANAELVGMSGTQQKF